MTMQTILQYNGVRLHNVQTLSFIETPINTDGGQFMYTKTELKVIGYVTEMDPTVGYHTQREGLTTAVFPHTGPGQINYAGASQQYSLLRNYLEQPRRRLVYSTMADGSPKNNDPNIGIPLFEIEPAPESPTTDDGLSLSEMKISTDVKGGPIPGPVVVAHIASNNVWRVEFTVIFHTIPPCISPSAGTRLSQTVPGQSLNPVDPLDQQIDIANIPKVHQHTQRKLGILSNRWSCQDHIDENGYTTRTYTGNVTLSNPNWNANDFRAMTVPPVIPGMQRRSIDYVSSEDNLSLRYTIVDHEVTATAPWPARNMKISHTESQTEFGAKGNFIVRISLTGERLTVLRDLMGLAFAIAEQRLRLSAVVRNDSTTSIILKNTDITTEQGTDQNHSLTLVMAGERYSIDNAPIIPGADLRFKASRAVAWRPVGEPVGWLAGYDNSLSLGNRPNEQPFTEGGIPAISCLHAKLTSPCSDSFSMEASASDSDEMNSRRSQVNALRAVVNKWDPQVSVNINDRAADEPVNLTFSEAHAQNLYSHYNITSAYGAKHLKVSLPIAKTSQYSTGAFNSVVQIGQPQPTRIIRIEAERAGAPPRMPQAVESFTEARNGAASASESVTNTLISAKATHLNPAPIADGVSLIYTSFLELEYSQNQNVASHRFGIPDYIRASPSSGELTTLNNPAKYSFPLASIFIPGTLEKATGWNA